MARSASSSFILPLIPSPVSCACLHRQPTYQSQPCPLLNLDPIFQSVSSLCSITSIHIHHQQQQSCLFGRHSFSFFGLGTQILFSQSFDALFWSSYLSCSILFSQLGFLVLRHENHGGSLGHCHSLNPPVCDRSRSGISCLCWCLCLTRPRCFRVSQLAMHLSSGHRVTGKPLLQVAFVRMTAQHSLILYDSRLSSNAFSRAATRTTTPLP